MKCPHPTCGHEWEPRKASPKKCPQCQNPLWRSPRPKKQKPVVFIDEQPEPQKFRIHHPSDEMPGSKIQMETQQIPTPIDDRKARAEQLLRQLA